MKTNMSSCLKYLSINPTMDNVLAWRLENFQFQRKYVESKLVGKTHYALIGVINPSKYKDKNRF